MPINNLCLAGIDTIVTITPSTGTDKGTGTVKRIWSCKGINSGENADCFAQQIVKTPSVCRGTILEPTAKMCDNANWHLENYENDDPSLERKKVTDCNTNSSLPCTYEIASTTFA
jgi:hypothetical protein